MSNCLELLSGNMSRKKNVTKWLQTYTKELYLSNKTSVNIKIDYKFTICNSLLTYRLN